MKNIIETPKTLLFLFLCMSLVSITYAQVIDAPTPVTPGTPLLVPYTVSGDLLKRISVEVSIPNSYANLTLEVAGERLLDNIDIPSGGVQLLNFVATFPTTGDVQLQLFANNQTITINTLLIEDISGLSIPSYTDSSAAIGLNVPDGDKYGGPSVADINIDGNYDMILNNHNDDESPSKLFFGSDNGMVTNETELSLFRLMDLHGSAAGDYDNDGDLDIIIALGGGNGTNPQPPLFYKNNNGTLVRSDADVGITSGARGRAPKWVDFDLDGDLDLALFNAPGINGGNNAQHIFYTNRGDGTFSQIAINGLENERGSRVLITDINKDQIDDVVFISPFAIWKGNGDFTFENVTATWLAGTGVAGTFGKLSALDVDIDNDGDLDLYITGGKEVFVIADNTSIDYDPVRKILDARTSGSEGMLTVDFEADTDVLDISKLQFARRNAFTGDFPVFLGSAMDIAIDNLNIGNAQTTIPDIQVTEENAVGFPNETLDNGLYIGYLGNGQWKLKTVRDADISFNIAFSIDGIGALTTVTPPAQNRNVQDILLRNDLNQATGDVGFTDVSDQWNIPKGGNHWGATAGDLNNDGFQDLFVYRYGYLRNRIADYILVNNGKGSFEITTHHNATVVGTVATGDMGQAFDYDLDGDVDLLNGDDVGGTWYLFENQKDDTGNYAIVKVGYSAINNVDPIAAEVTITTTNGLSLYKRVGSAGASYSQSLLNMIHFGLGASDKISNITIRWRNGEMAEFNDEDVNQIFDTNLLDPTQISIVANPFEVRVGTSKEVILEIEPIFANREVIWRIDDENVATVDQNGVVSGIAEGQSTELTVTSVADSSITATTTINVIAFTAIPAESVTLNVENIELVEGNSVALEATVAPPDADDKSLIWSSSDETIATVDQNGIVTAVAEGIVTIKVALSSDPTSSDQTTVNVIQLVATSLAFDNPAIYSTTEYAINGTIDVTVNYHAGTGNKVIAGANGGIRYFIRHLTSSFGLIRDFDVIVDDTVLNTESGTSTASLNINLEDLPDGSAPIVPSADLENGEFYFLFVSFSSSNGESKNVSSSPIIIVDKGLSIDETASSSKEVPVAMFPNPAKNRIYFSGLSDVEHTVTIENVLGQKLLTKKIRSNDRIAINNLKKGIYTVNIKTKSPKTSSYSFVLVKE